MSAQQLPPETLRRAQTFLNQCAPHMRSREWYGIIETLVAALRAAQPSSDVASVTKGVADQAVAELETAKRAATLPQPSSDARAVEEKFVAAANVLHGVDTLLVQAGFAQDCSIRHQLSIAQSMFREAERAANHFAGVGNKVADEAFKEGYLAGISAYATQPPQEPAVPEGWKRGLEVLANIAVTESEIEQATKYGNRIIFEKGGVITVADVLAARHLLAAAPEPVHAPGAIDQRDRFGMSAAPASGKGS